MGAEMPYHQPSPYPQAPTFQQLMRFKERSFVSDQLQQDVTTYEPRSANPDCLRMQGKIALNRSWSTYFTHYRGEEEEEQSLHPHPSADSTTADTVKNQAQHTLV